MIQLESLTLGYGQQVLLERVSASLDGGGLIALLGRNGSGKSTLLRATAGLGKIKSGRILLAGKDLAGLRPEELARTVSFSGCNSARSFPASNIRPDLIVPSPAVARSKVLFPLPLRPSRAISPPPFKLADTWSSRLCCPNPKVNASNCIMLVEGFYILPI